MGTAIVMYSLGVSGFVMLGGKLGQRFGSKIFFQVAVALFLAAMVIMVLSPTATVMLAGQALAGFAGASLVPSLVALIANHYRGAQQAKAVGWLGSARAIAGVLAFVIVGYVAMINWRLAFGLLIVHASVLLLLSFKLKPSVAKPEVKIDVVGVILSAVAVILISFGFNNLRNWGLTLARPAAPFDLFGVSPAPLMIALGIVIFMAFFLWSHKQATKGKTPLLALRGGRFAEGMGGGFHALPHRHDGSRHQLHGAALHPDHPGSHQRRDVGGDDALHADGVLHRDPDRAPL